VKPLFTIIFAVFLTTSCAYAQKSPTPATETQEDRMVNFYPNPATTFINFEYRKTVTQQYDLQIYNFMGRKVLDIKKFPNRLRVPLQDFIRGMYIYQLRDQNGQIIESGKFQIVK
jgi:outer membrane biogenesis lipoprotein LolB